MASLNLTSHFCYSDYESKNTFLILFDGRIIYRGNTARPKSVAKSSGSSLMKVPNRQCIIL